ncbi:MAG: DNA recombination protein RmuC [Dehalococcoidia bacterium]|jgi:DNA anti-recombination protein RmuC|nr:DNA recombination protein RmuC [Dehalococcoidia bacterium]
MTIFNILIIIFLLLILFALSGISILFFIRFSKYFSGMKFKEFADDTTIGVENKVKELLTIKDDKFTKDLKDVKELVTKQYDTTLKETLNLITTGNELRKQNKNTEDAINIAKNEFSKLTNVLSGSQSRGQLGELMAEDIFRSAGFIKGVQYETQQVLDNGTRPDFTLKLPEGKVIHMDSKFIWEHFQPLMDDEVDNSEQQLREKKFFDTLKKNIIDEVGDKYINTQENTLDNVIVFVPSDHILSYIYDKRMDLIQYAQSKKVTITSPGNLLLVVGVIKEFMKVVTIGENQTQIIAILEGLQSEWDKYVEEQGVIERALKSATTHHNNLMGRRRKALDNQFQAVRELETQLDENPDKALDVSLIDSDIKEVESFTIEDETEDNEKQMSFDN